MGHHHRKTLSDFYVGICPACSKPVAADDPDGPVWTCPANLRPENSYWEPQEGITEAMRKKAGVYSNCWEDFGRPCYPSLPLHGACYDKGNY